jgi:hypothetical protein
MNKRILLCLLAVASAAYPKHHGADLCFRARQAMKDSVNQRRAPLFPLYLWSSARMFASTASRSTTPRYVPTRLPFLSIRNVSGKLSVEPYRSAVA